MKGTDDESKAILYSEYIYIFIYFLLYIYIWSHLAVLKILKANKVTKKRSDVFADTAGDKISSKKSKSNEEDAVPIGVHSKKNHKGQAIPTVRNHICTSISWLYGYFLTNEY